MSEFADQLKRLQNAQLLKNVLPNEPDMSLIRFNDLAALLERYERLGNLLKETRTVLSGVGTRLCLTDPQDLVKLGGQGPPWTLWTLAESLEDTIGPIDATLTDCPPLNPPSPDT